MPQTRQDELPEYVFEGPFGGVQSEVPLDRIERTGFDVASNIMFRKSAAYLRPPYNLIAGAAGAPEPIIGFADFFDVTGTRRQVMWTVTRMFQWNSNVQVWDQVLSTSGALLTGTQGQLMAWDVIGYKLYFSQSADKVQVWDGISATYDVASTSSNPSKYLFELGFHLIAANQVVGGTLSTQRVQWSVAGDGTDWTSFGAGQVDLFNNLGPINGGGKIFQYGYFFQYWGITQIIPTGNALAPFQFFPLGAKSKGNTIANSLAIFGESRATYVGKNNIYNFDGTTSVPIADRPIDGNRRVGARKRIFADLVTNGFANVFAFLSTSLNGNDFEAYWLFMPTLNQAWVYNYDEGNWTLFKFLTGRTLNCAGVHYRQGIIRVMDLIGTIQDQNWTPSGLLLPSPFDVMALGFTNGQVANIDFTTVAGNEFVQFALASGQLRMDDTRHSHTALKIRMCVVDNGINTVALTVSNEKNQSETHNITFGTSNPSGRQLTIVQGVKINGKYLRWQITGDSFHNHDFQLDELAIVYDVSGEVSGATG